MFLTQGHDALSPYLAYHSSLFSVTFRLFLTIFL